MRLSACVLPRLWSGIVRAAGAASCASCAEIVAAGVAAPDLGRCFGRSCRLSAGAPRRGRGLILPPRLGWLLGLLPRSSSALILAAGLRAWQVVRLGRRGRSLFGAAAEIVARARLLCPSAAGASASDLLGVPLSLCWLRFLPPLLWVVVLPCRGCCRGSACVLALLVAGLRRVRYRPPWQVLRVAPAVLCVSSAGFCRCRCPCMPAALAVASGAFWCFWWQDMRRRCRGRRF